MGSALVQLVDIPQRGDARGVVDPVDAADGERERPA